MATLGGYGAVDGSSSQSGNDVGGRDVIDISNPITTAGTVESFAVWMNAAHTAGHQLKLKIWRLNGANYDVIGESQAFEMLSSGLNSGLTLSAAITGVDVGDYVGVWLSPSANNKVDLNGGVTGSYVKYYGGDNTTPTPASSFSTFTNYALCVEVYGTAGGSDTTVNATLATISVSTYTATVVTSSSTIVNATLGAIGVSAFDATIVTEASITTDVLKNNTGTVLASTSGIVASVYDLSTGALVVRKTGLTSNGSGVVTFSDVLLSNGTEYLVTITIATADGVARITAG